MRILGIDPGLRITGYGCIEGDAIRPKIVEAGVFRLATSSPVPPVADRLVELDHDLRELIERVRTQDHRSRRVVCALCSS